MLSSILNASNENVENVVKPPHTPVFQNRTVFLDISSRLLVSPTINPISTAPRMLVIKVITGNSLLTGIRLMAYLAIAPKAPPSATNINSIYHNTFDKNS